MIPASEDHETPEVDDGRIPALTIHFQGLCAFVRNDERLTSTDEAVVILVDPEGSRLDLCRHSPILMFRETSFRSASEPFHHATALLPAPATDPAAGRSTAIFWPLNGLDLEISAADSHALELDRSFSRIADIGNLAGAGALHPSCLDETPPRDRLVGGRVYLTSGIVGVESDAIRDGFSFRAKGTASGAATELPFAFEVRYQFFSDSNSVELKAKEFGGGEPRKLLLDGGSHITITNLCPFERRRIETERDFLAYYNLLERTLRERPIPHNESNDVGLGMSACPPTSMFINRELRIA